MARTVDASRVKEFQDSPEELEEKVVQLAQLVQASKYTVFFTGAGVSTAAGIADYRGPSGCWTLRHIRDLEKKGSGRSAEETKELKELKEEVCREITKKTSPIPALDSGRGDDGAAAARKTSPAAAGKKKSTTSTPKDVLDPGFAHMAITTLIRSGLADYVVTTNLDGLFRKAGLAAHEELCCLHGDIFTERCTGCGTEFERNYRVRRPNRHVHDHRVWACPRCGSDAPKEWTGVPKGAQATTTAMRKVTVRQRPAPGQVSFEQITAKAREQLGPSATLVSVNGEKVEQHESAAGTGAEVEEEMRLRKLVAAAQLPLEFVFRVKVASQGKGRSASTGGGTSFEQNHLVGVRDENVGTKDTHINFGENLDDWDWKDADEHSRKADLCIVLGTSMSLRHVTHFPFLAKRTVIVNLQATPDDHKCYHGLRIWGTCDDVLRLLLQHLGDLQVLPVPAWRPRDAVPLADLSKVGVPVSYQAVSKHLEQAARKREQEQELGRSMAALAVEGSGKLDEESEEQEREARAGGGTGGGAHRNTLLARSAAIGGRRTLA